jgi:hypothetical protein
MTKTNLLRSKFRQFTVAQLDEFEERGLNSVERCFIEGVASRGAQNRWNRLVITFHSWRTSDHGEKLFDFGTLQEFLNLSSCAPK